MAAGPYIYQLRRGGGFVKKGVVGGIAPKKTSVLKSNQKVFLIVIAHKFPQAFFFPGTILPR